MRLHIVRCPVLFYLILWIYHYSTIQCIISNNNITFIIKVKYKRNRIFMKNIYYLLGKSFCEVFSEE